MRRLEGVLSVAFLELLTASAARQEQRHRPAAEPQSLQPERQPAHQPREQQERRQQAQPERAHFPWWQQERLLCQGWRLPASRRPSASAPQRVR